MIHSGGTEQAVLSILRCASMFELAFPLVQALLTA